MPSNSFMGVPIHPMPINFLHYNYNGSVRAGKVYLRKDMALEKKAWVLKHEIKHLDFYTKHKLLGAIFGREELLYSALFLYGFLLFLGLYPLAILFSLPWILNVCHEFQVYCSMLKETGYRPMAQAMLGTWVGGFLLISGLGMVLSMGL